MNFKKAMKIVNTGGSVWLDKSHTAWITALYPEEYGAAGVEVMNTGDYTVPFMCEQDRDGTVRARLINVLSLINHRGFEDRRKYYV